MKNKKKKKRLKNAQKVWAPGGDGSLPGVVKRVRKAEQRTGEGKNLPTHREGDASREKAYFQGTGEVPKEGNSKKRKASEKKGGGIIQRERGRRLWGGGKGREDQKKSGKRWEVGFSQGERKKKRGKGITLKARPEGLGLGRGSRGLYHELKKLFQKRGTPTGKFGRIKKVG